MPLENSLLAQHRPQAVPECGHVKPECAFKAAKSSAQCDRATSTRCWTLHGRIELDATLIEMQQNYCHNCCRAGGCWFLPRTKSRSCSFSARHGSEACRACRQTGLHDAGGRISEGCSGVGWEATIRGMRTDLLCWTESTYGGVHVSIALRSRAVLARLKSQSLFQRNRRRQSTEF